MQIINIQHRHQISYLLHENEKWLVFDAGWPDSFQIFTSIMKEHDIQFQDIAYLLVSHFHMDHCGTLEQFKQHGVTLLLHECQAGAVERANHFFLKNQIRHLCLSPKPIRKW